MSKIFVINGDYNTYIVFNNKKYNVEYLEFYDGHIELSWEEVLVHPRRNKIVLESIRDFENDTKEISWNFLLRFSNR